MAAASVSCVDSHDFKFTWELSILYLLHRWLTYPVTYLYILPYLRQLTFCSIPIA